VILLWSAASPLSDLDGHAAGHHVPGRQVLPHGNFFLQNMKLMRPIFINALPSNTFKTTVSADAGIEPRTVAVYESH
jgi:hypothetical protein